MGEVVRHLDRISRAPGVRFAASDYRRCSQEPVCRFRRVMLEARKHGGPLDGQHRLWPDVMRGKPVSKRRRSLPQFRRSRGEESDQARESRPRGQNRHNSLDESAPFVSRGSCGCFEVARAR